MSLRALEETTEPNTHSLDLGKHRKRVMVRIYQWRRRGCAGKPPTDGFRWVVEGQHGYEDDYGSIGNGGALP